MARDRLAVVCYAVCGGAHYRLYRRGLVGHISAVGAAVRLATLAIIALAIELAAWLFGRELAYWVIVSTGWLPLR